ncbi:MAG TPA: DUF1080 domain-containing protein [Sedimentisphaerales bacterium]|jgi:hypothetical protein|nr:DUF1080 domain-containing protein [Sedimentisphaerales bacterium]HNU29711.1 DUF1080 domain-containing protein [Sedimentisphaerales bacterium]
MRVVVSVRGGRRSAGRSDPTHNSAVVWGVFLVAAGLLPGGCRSEGQRREPSAPVQAATQPQAEPVQVPSPEEPKAPAQPVAQADEPTSLFDGQSLGQWKPTDFGGQGEVSVQDGAIHMAMGSCMTGITWTGPVVRTNYEITLEAMRVAGNDFFCGLTFPVGERPCTLVLGGWGGSVCGLSSIDYYDASENPTTRIVSFETGKWYFVRLRVTPDRIQAWLDGEDLVDFETTGHKIGIRMEVEESQPLGIATWNTAGAVRNIKVRRLPEQGE